MRLAMRVSMLGATTIACVAGLSIGPAFADAIDGEWCLGNSVMRIDGSSIVTPGGNAITGQYNRYRYAYVVPANEPGAGTEINMVMIRGQELVHLRRAGQAGDPEVWRRCKPIS